MNIKESLNNWAVDAIEKLNAVSKNTATQYYLQSPLDQINTRIDTLVLGINPGSTESGVTKMESPEEFLKGNPTWRYRFQCEEEGAHVSPLWAKYFGNAHFMIYGDQERHNLLTDNDSKTVWQNLTPFATPDASKLSKEHFESGIPVAVQLIDILKPKRIVLLTTNGFNLLGQYARVESSPIVKDITTNRMIEMGTIEKIPTIQLPHPSGDWGMPKFIIPMIVKMHRLHAVDEKVNSLEEAATKIKNQLKRIEVM
ncbi:MAG: hypothetical protein K2L14_06490 [Duncaniella sp.]|nr:hypothetical protein [Duncaniella sp.]